jgi:hypothetical protein
MMNDGAVEKWTSNELQYSKNSNCENAAMRCDAIKRTTRSISTLRKYSLSLLEDPNDDDVCPGILIFRVLKIVFPFKQLLTTNASLVARA